MIQGKLKINCISCLGSFAVLQCFHICLFNPSFSAFPAREDEAGSCVFSKVTNL